MTRPLKVLLNVALARYGGYGSDGIDIADALIRKGADVYLNPVLTRPPLPQPVADLLTKPLDAPFDLMITHVDPGTMDVTPEQRAATDLAVGWSMWEFSTLDNLKSLDTVAERMGKLDALIGYSEVSTAAFRAAAPAHLPLGTLQGGFNPSLWPQVERDWASAPFRFVMNGIMNARKNPLAAIMAFAELKAAYPEEFEPAELHVHSRIQTLPTELMQHVPKLWIFCETFTEQQMRQFYQLGHVGLTTSRGEGKNLPALEMLSTGIPVIYTDWSGHRQWGSTDYGYPVRVDLAPVSAEEYPGCRWAEVDKQQLKETMLHCFRNRDEVREKGFVAAEAISRSHSWDTVMDRFFDLLPELVPGKGEEIRRRYVLSAAS